MTVQLGLVDDGFFPAPTSIASKFGELAQSGELLPNTLISLQGLFFGFLLRVSPALALSLVMGHYSPYALCARPAHLRNVSAGSEQVTILKRMELTTSRAETTVYSAMLNTSFYVVRSTRFNVGRSG
jgi:hypothetical protein